MLMFEKLAGWNKLFIETDLKSVLSNQLIKSNDQLKYCNQLLTIWQL